LRKAFDVFDPTNNGYFTTDQLKKMLTQFGENLDEAEFKELLKSTTVQPDDTINIEGIGFVFCLFLKVIIKFKFEILFLF